MTVRELREKRNKLIADARELLSASINAGQALSGDDKAKIEKLRAEATEIGDMLRSAEELEAEARSMVPESQRPSAGHSFESASRDDSFRRFVIAGEMRDQSLTGSEGGFTVSPDTSFYGRVQSALKEWSGVEKAPVTVLTTATGADLPIPTDDDTSNVGALVAEAGSHASGTIVTLGQTTMKSYLYSSKIVKVSKQLLADSQINWESFLAQKFGVRLGRAKNLALTTGTGSSQPQGVQYASTTGRTCATGSTTTPTPDDLVRLVHSVDPAYRNPAVARWMFSDATALILRLLKDGDGQYLWKSGLTDGAPGQLLGYPVVINPDMPAMTAGLKPVIFGDFSQYYVRNVQGIEVVRLNELYAANGQVGFMAFVRFDGALIDAGTHPVKGLVMAAS